MLVNVKIRGQEFDVELISVSEDNDTNSVEIYWICFDLIPFELTDSENESIEDQLYQSWIDSSDDSY